MLKHTVVLKKVYKKWDFTKQCKRDYDLPKRMIDHACFSRMGHFQMMGHKKHKHHTPDFEVAQFVKIKTIQYW